MKQPDDAERDAALLRWLKEGTPESNRERAEIEDLKRTLVGGKRERRELDALTRALLPTNREPTSQDEKHAKKASLSWRSLCLELDEVRAWLRNGIEPDEGEVVRFLIEEGIEPARLNEVIEHAQSGERLTILEVVRRYFRDYRTHEYRSLGEALDNAGVERERDDQRFA